MQCRPSTNAVPTLPILTVPTTRIVGSKKTGHLARTGEKRNTYKILVENALRGGEHTGNQGAYESIKLQWKSENGNGSV